MQLMKRYSKFVSKYPLLIIGVSIVICFSLTIVTFVLHDLPDFSNPTVGFNTSGTEISDRASAWRTFQDDIGFGRRFHQFYTESSDSSKNARPAKKITPPSKKKNRSKNQTGFFEGHRMDTAGVNENCSLLGKCIDLNDHFFEPRYCPFDSGVQIDQLAVMSVDITGINFESFQGLCALEEAFWRLESPLRLIDYNQACLRHHQKKICCQPWHLGSVAASMFHLQHCSDINSTVFQRIKEHILFCFGYRQLIKECWSRWSEKSDPQTSFFGSCNASLPINCTSFHHVTFFETLLAKDVEEPSIFGDSMFENQISTLIILPIHKDDVSHTKFMSTSLKRIAFFDTLLKIETLKLTSAELGLKNELFLDFLIDDTRFGVLAFLLVLLCVYLYTGALLFTLVTLLSVFMSLGVAYFFYTVLFRQFFPFANLLTMVLMIGLGADDAFIYRTAWKRAKHAKNTVAIERIVSDSLSHAWNVMLITSLTTACAFFTNLMSKILVLKCFGLFAGLAVTVNFLLSVTFLPACVVVLDWNCDWWWQKIQESSSTIKSRMDLFGGYVSFGQFRQRLVDHCKEILECFIPFLVIRLRFLWLSLFMSIFLGSLFIVLYYPGVKLPNETDSDASLSSSSINYFQYFHDDHIFEQWDRTQKKRFPAFNPLAEIRGIPMSIRIVWGLKPGQSDPVATQESNVLLRENMTFDLYSRKTLDFLNLFCNDLMANRSIFSMDRNINFSPTPMITLPFCFATDFLKWMESECDSLPGETRYPCCKSSSLSYKSDLIEKCLKKLLNGFPHDWKMKSEYTFGNIRDGPFFDRNGTLKILSVSFPSKFNFTTNFRKMNVFYESTDKWVKDKLSTGPKDVQQGWFISDHLEIYDLQKALIDGTRISILISVFVALACLFIATGDPLISFLCAINIAAVIFDTLALMILMDWQLNVLESTVVILTVGLSFDFTSHLGAAYLNQASQMAANVVRRPPSVARHRSSFVATLDPTTLVIMTLETAGGPILAAALTTALAGAAVLPARTIAFRRVGTFMIIITCVSWLRVNLWLGSALTLVPVRLSQLSTSHGARRSMATPYDLKQKRKSTTMQDLDMITTSLTTRSALEMPRHSLRNIFMSETLLINNGPLSSPSSRKELTTRRMSLPVVRANNVRLNYAT